MTEDHSDLIPSLTTKPTHNITVLYKVKWALSIAIHTLQTETAVQILETDTPWSLCDPFMTCNS